MHCNTLPLKTVARQPNFVFQRRGWSGFQAIPNAAASRGGHEAIRYAAPLKNKRILSGAGVP
jgi:hypothetical protein